ncbi:mercury resistance system transport protein MerF [Pseudovibrio ascidiaceicola]|uniref:mercury resistance system transport protein MerF n=1 Tax=Pseudovibrio ascidiaceicola TaxID=285279 RepID=UPI003D364F4E
MKDQTYLRVGIVGTVIAAICCFTPILIILLGTLGLSALAIYLDAVLLPVLGVFVLLTIFSFWRKYKRA